jgi:hypothetical protein
VAGSGGLNANPSMQQPHSTLVKKTPDEFYFASLPTLPKAA